MNSSARHRLAGLALALGGVALHVFASAALTGETATFVAYAGRLLGVTGLLLVGRSVQLRLRQDAKAAPDPN